MNSYWKDEYDKLEVNEILNTKFKNLSPEAKQALAPSLLAEQQNKPDNPWRRKERQGIHYNVESFEPSSTREADSYGY